MYMKKRFWFTNSKKKKISTFIKMDWDLDLGLFEIGWKLYLGLFEIKGTIFFVWVVLYQKIWYLCLHTLFILMFYRVIVCTTLLCGEHGMWKKSVWTIALRENCPLFRVVRFRFTRQLTQNWNVFYKYYLVNFYKILL